MRKWILIVAAFHVVLGLYAGLSSLAATHRAWAETRTGGWLLPGAIAVITGVVGAVFYRGCREFMERKNRPLAADIAVTTALIIWGLGSLAALEGMRMNLFPMFGPAGLLAPYAMWSYLAHAIYRRVLRPMADRGATEA